MTTQLIYTVTYPTATPGTLDFYINISVENNSRLPITLKALQIYLPLGGGDNDLTPVYDISSIIADSPVDWTQTAQLDKSGANLEVIFVYSIGSGIVIQPDDPALNFSLSNITVNDSFGIATCTLNEFTDPFVANSESDFSIPKPATPPTVSLTANTYSINAGDNVVVTWAGPSDWVYAITYGSVRLPPTTCNNGSVALSLLLSTDVTLQLTQAGHEPPPTPWQIRIEVTPKISLTGTVQPTLNSLYQLALDWTSLGASAVYGLSTEPMELSGSQIVALSYADAHGKSCADYAFTAMGQDTEARCPCAIAPPAINSFTLELLQDANGHYYIILKWDVSGAFYVAGSWLQSPALNSFNPTDHSASIYAPFDQCYTITAYVLNDVAATQTLQTSAYFSAPIIKQFSYTIAGETLTIIWDVQPGDQHSGVSSVQGSWQSASLPLAGKQTLHPPFASSYTLTANSVVSQQATQQALQLVNWQLLATPIPLTSRPYLNCIATANNTCLIGCYDPPGGGVVIVSNGTRVNQIRTTDTVFEKLFTTMLATSDGRTLILVGSTGQVDFACTYDVNTAQYLGGYPLLNGGCTAITPDNVYLYSADIKSIVKVGLADSRQHLMDMPSYLETDVTCISVTPNGEYVFIGVSFDWATGNGYVVPVSVQSNGLLSSIALSNKNPCSIACTPDSQYALVLSDRDNTVSVVDLSSFSVTDTLSVGGNPTSITVTPDGRYALVINTGNYTLSIIAINTFSIVATIPLGYQPNSLVVTPDSHCAVVANVGKAVSVISLDSLSVVQTLTANTDGESFSLLAVSPDGNTLYIAGEGGIFSQFCNSIGAS